MAREGAQPAALAAPTARLIDYPVDWDQPWFQPFRESGRRVLARVGQGLPLHEALNAESPGPVRFVPPAALPPGTAYEQYIHESSRCPTRPGLHDFFNGLCWLRLPRAKKQLNLLQAAAIAAAPPGSARGPLRDAITLFDENGVLLDAPAALWQALLERDWHRLFVLLRPLWDEARLLIFGHALLEKLALPRKAITAHVWRAQVPLTDPVQADAWLVGELTPARLAAKPFTPLPLLGVPGWWAENQNFSFYDDSVVFRPPRARQPEART